MAILFMPIQCEENESVGDLLDLIEDCVKPDSKGPDEFRILLNHNLRRFVDLERKQTPVLPP